ncbi:MAG: NTP transferase domain-containing protein [Thermoanaerobaculia bacterium]
MPKSTGAEPSAGQRGSRHPLPLIIMAGSDPQPATLPEAGAKLHPLRGPKGMALKVRGRPLIDLLLERLRGSGCFEPIFIAGPARVYGAARAGARVIDTDVTFGKNIQAALEEAVVECPGQPIAVTSCDILPEVEELHDLMDDYYRNAPLDFWFPLILAPEEARKLGASAWKPQYRIAPQPGEEPKSLLPGHLVVIDPDAMRLELVYRSFNVAYAGRNRGILYRLALIVSHVFVGLLVQDLRQILRLRLPTLTFTVIHNGVAFALQLRRGVSTPDELADRLHRIFVSYRHRRRFPDRRGRLPLMKALWLAKDIDTVEEARELAGDFG